MFLFLQKIVFYREEFVVLKDMLTAKQHEKHAFQDLKATRLLLDGEVWREPK